MNQSESIAKLAEALAKAQGEMKNATFDKVNPHYKSKYASLASVIDASKAPLHKHSLSVAQTMEVRGGGIVLRTILMHSSGEWIASEFPLPSEATPQQIGSALTYARRYSLTAIISNAADEDDDANAAETTQQKINATGKSPVTPQKVKAPDNKEPHSIPVPTAEDGSTSNWIVWAQTYLAALERAKTKEEIQEWSIANNVPLATMGKDVPKIYKRLSEVSLDLYDKLET